MYHNSSAQNESNTSKLHSMSKIPIMPIFLDRDGTLIEERHYLCDPDKVELSEKAIEGLALMQEAGLQPIVVTNQSGIGRGYYTVEAMHSVHKRIISELEKSGLAAPRFYFCPHVPEEDCVCRKPKTGMYDQFLSDFVVRNATPLYMIGDKECDILFGRGIRATTILVKTGYGKEYDLEKMAAPDHIVNDLEEAALLIMPKLKDQK